MRALLRMADALVEQYTGSFTKVPKRIVLDVDDTFDAVHGAPATAPLQRALRRLRPFSRSWYSTCRPVGRRDDPPGQAAERASGARLPAPPDPAHPIDLAAGRDPGARRQSLRLPRRRWRTARPTRWTTSSASANDLDPAPPRRNVEASTAERFAAGDGGKVRRSKEFYDAAASWNRARRIIARVEVGPQGADTRFIVTSLEKGKPRGLYEDVYCRRGQAENHIKAFKTHLAADRTSCSRATANQMRLFLHAAAYWLLWTLRSPWRVPKPLPVAQGPVRHHPAPSAEGGGQGHRVRDPGRRAAAVRLSGPGDRSAAGREDPAADRAAVAAGAMCPLAAN